jgi:aryl-alcohol dehydrogenase-like predicted oxidoreductase
MKENLKLITTFQELADEMEISLAQLSLAWLLAQDDSIVPIPGMKQQKYIDENIKAVDMSLTKESLEQINTMEVSVKGRQHNQYNLEFIDE